MTARGTLPIARLAGITIDVHWSFLLVLGWGAWRGWQALPNATGILSGLVAVVVLFVWVVLHEMGHALAARGFGLVAHRVTLLPIGGLARLQTSPTEPQQELSIALSGPMVNLALLLMLAVGVWLTTPQAFAWGMLNITLAVPPTFPALLEYSFWINAILFFFNMLPAFPMDGGRIIRAALAILFNYEVGTRIAAWLARTLAIAMVGFGMVGFFVDGLQPNYILAIVGLMVYFGARIEERSVLRRRALVRVEVGRVMHPPTRTLAPSQPITRAVVRDLLEADQMLPVVVDGRVVGLLDYHDVVRQQRQMKDRSQLLVAHAMNPSLPVITPRDTLWAALREMQNTGLDMLPVSQRGQFCGLITYTDIDRAWRAPLWRRRRRR